MRHNTGVVTTSLAWLPNILVQVRPPAVRSLIFFLLKFTLKRALMETLMEIKKTIKTNLLMFYFYFYTKQKWKMEDLNLGLWVPGQSFTVKCEMPCIFSMGWYNMLDLWVMYRHTIYWLVESRKPDILFGRWNSTFSSINPKSMSKWNPTRLKHQFIFQLSSTFFSYSHSFRPSTSMQLPSLLH